jgi:hypothetical protein
MDILTVRWSHRWGAGLTVAIMGVLMALTAPPADAQLRRAYTGGIPGSMGIPQPEPKITLSLKQRALGRVLSEIFKQTPYKYAVTTSVGGRFFDADFKGEPLSKALTKVLAQDTSSEALVFYFTPASTGDGTFTITREFMVVGEVDGEPKVSLGNARLTKVLPEVFRLMNANYRVEPDVPPVLISLELRPTRWNQSVLDQVMNEAYKQEPTVTYSKDGDTYVVHLQKTPTTLTSARKVRLTFNNTPLKDALGQLFTGSTWKYQVADAVPEAHVSYNATNQPELAVLQELLKQVAQNGPAVTYREGPGVLYIEPGPLPGQYLTGRAVRETFKMDYVFRATPFAQALQRIAQGTGAVVEVRGNIPNVPVSFPLKNATIEDGLDALLRATRAQLPTLGYKKVSEGRYQLGLGVKDTP